MEILHLVIVKAIIGYHAYVDGIRNEVFQQVIQVKKTEEIEIIRKAILSMFYSSVELTSLLLDGFRNYPFFCRHKGYGYV
jgi:hypothetical protein